MNINEEGFRMKIRLKNNENRVKVCKIGFSFTTLFFGAFVPLWRADFKWTMVMFGSQFVVNYIVGKFPVVTSVTSFYRFACVYFVLNLIFALIYNKIFIKTQLLCGFVGYDKENEEKLEAKKIVVTKEEIEQYNNKLSEKAKKREEKKLLKQEKEKEKLREKREKKQRAKDEKEKEAIDKDNNHDTNNKKEKDSKEESLQEA